MMSLFQKTIEQNYLQQLDGKLIEFKYNQFKSHFANPEIQENIRNCKKVYFAPVLKDEIKNGKCSISGNFTLKELTQLKSLITNKTLPLDFTVK